MTNLMFVVVLAGGYYFTWRVSQKTLTEIDIGIRNVSGSAARDITFEFSHKVESSNEFIISDLPYFKYGLDFLPPNGEINCYWGELDSLLPILEKRGLQSGIFVTVRYKDLAGKPYESQWKLNPFLYKDTRIVNRRGMGHLVAAVERLAVSAENSNRQRSEAGDEENTAP